MVAQQQMGLEPTIALSFLVASQGDADLAAIAAMRALKRPVEPAELLTAIATDPTAAAMLGQQARVLIQLRMLEAFKLLDVVFREKLDNLSPKDAAKAYTDLAHAMSSVAGQAPAQPTDPYKAVLDKLPPEIRDAVDYFVQNPDASRQLSSGASDLLDGTTSRPAATTRPLTHNSPRHVIMGSDAWGPCEKGPQVLDEYELDDSDDAAS